MSEFGGGVVGRRASGARGEDLGFVEFVALMALMQATAALSIDAVLPSFPQMRTALALTDPNDAALVITMFVAGLALGPVPFGVAADRWGRRPTVLAGLAIYLLGALVAATASSESAMLIGRFAQGFGAAGPRSLVLTIARDRYSGARMARVMSFVMATFILAPIFAPLFGAGSVWAWGWRGPFWVMVGIAAMTAVWAGLRLPETGRDQGGAGGFAGTLGRGARAMLASRQALGATVAQGFALAAMLSYLGSVERVLGEAYGLGEAFVFIFAAMGLFIGGASILNGRLVARLGMFRLSAWALGGLAAAGAAFGAAILAGAAGSLVVFLIWSSTTLFCFGVLLGNLGALAMQPLGGMAGVGAALVTSVSSLMAAPLGAWIAGAYAGDGLHLAFGFSACGAAALLCLRFAASERREGA